MKSPKAHLLDGFCSADGTDAIKLSSTKARADNIEKLSRKKICLILSLFLSSFLLEIKSEPKRGKKFYLFAAIRRARARAKVFRSFESHFACPQHRLAL